MNIDRRALLLGVGAVTALPIASVAAIVEAPVRNFVLEKNIVLLERLMDQQWAKVVNPVWVMNADGTVNKDVSAVLAQDTLAHHKFLWEIYSRLCDRLP